ncbi:MAG: hypothetical protein R8J85_10155 [Mariprofundales bacterium]
MKPLAPVTTPFVILLPMSDAIQWRRLQPLLAFIFSAALFGYWQWISPALAGTDGYYHIAIANMVWQQGIHFPFPYLEMTLLDSKHFVDMHMLYHIMQAPFTAIFDDLAIAAKVSSTLFAATACALFVWILQQHRIPWPLFWLLVLLVSSSAFLYRMMMPRPPVFAFIYMMLFFHFAINKRFVALGVVALFFTWTYKVFPIMIPMTLFAMITYYYTEKVLNLKPMFTVAVGMALGLMLTPWFPDNVAFLWDAIRMKILAGSYHTSVGNEWYSSKAIYYLKHAYIPLLAYAAGLLLTNRSEWRSDPARLFWFLMATMWLVFTFKSRRFIEFLTPSALLFFIFSIRGWLQYHAIPNYWRHHHLYWPAAALLLVVAVSSHHTFSRISHSMKHKDPVDSYKQCANWLITHTSKGSRVFNTDWDDFPKLLFHNPHNTYIVGLDPDYMRLKDEDRYFQWRKISKGKERKHPAHDILYNFDARYVFTDDGHKAFRWFADRNRFMKQRYHDENCHVYEIIGYPARHSNAGQAKHTQP